MSMSTMPLLKYINQLRVTPIHQLFSHSFTLTKRLEKGILGFIHESKSQIIYLALTAIYVLYPLTHSPSPN